MIGYVLRRITAAVGVLLIVSVAVFSLLHLAPGDTAAVLAGPDASQETLDAIRADLGLDRPLPVQYVEWVSELVRGDLGESYTVRRPVAELIGQRVGSTLQLTIAATCILIVLGVAMGITLANSRTSAAGRAIDQLATLFLALPPFVSGIILIFLFAVVWGVLPPGGQAPFVAEPAQPSGASSSRASRWPSPPHR